MIYFSARSMETKATYAGAFNLFTDSVHQQAKPVSANNRYPDSYRVFIRGWEDNGVPESEIPPAQPQQDGQKPEKISNLSRNPGSKRR
jgi:uncharacterized protein YmfQ (DUF2313 family)